jgi:hypothetical protein
MMFDRRLVHNFDWGLLAAVTLLAMVGATATGSTGAGSSGD